MSEYAVPQQPAVHKVWHLRLCACENCPKPHLACPAKLRPEDEATTYENEVDCEDCLAYMSHRPW